MKKRRGHEWNSETEFSHRMEVHYSQNSFRFQEVSLKREIESKVILLFRFGRNNGRLGEKWGAIPVDREQRRGKTCRENSRLSGNIFPLPGTLFFIKKLCCSSLSKRGNLSPSLPRVSPSRSSSPLLSPLSHPYPRLCVYLMEAHS